MTEKASEVKKCSCGHTKEDKYVILHKEYSLSGNILQMIGISVQPKKIRYQCIKCHMYFDETTDQTLLKKEM